MRDWQKLVRERLGELELNAAEKEEVCAELAGHLEDDYLSLLGQGIPEPAAMRLTSEHIDDWRDLKAKIEFARKKESFMNQRVSQFWFPAFLTLLLAMTVLMVIEEIGPKPWVSAAWSKSPRMVPVLVVYLCWLVTLPFIGAWEPICRAAPGAGYARCLPRSFFRSCPILHFLRWACPSPCFSTTTSPTTS